MLACDVCGRKFGKVEEMTKHKTEFHVQFDCGQCCYKSFGKKDLAYHEKSKHINHS